MVHLWLAGCSNYSGNGKATNVRVCTNMYISYACMHISKYTETMACVRLVDGKICAICEMLGDVVAMSCVIIARSNERATNKRASEHSLMNARGYRLKHDFLRSPLCTSCLHGTRAHRPTLQAFFE